uniref:Uncharacterized protein n=1 Tax=Oryza barthii TaxID=65489 RepID=A0A0D3EKB2_9ORYZ
MPAMEEEAVANEAHHFLVVTYPAQGHINPARHLARRLARAAPGARVTISTAVSACRKMFGDAAAAGAGGELVDEGGVRYAPYSDGYDDGFDRAVHDSASYMTQVRVVGARTLAAVIEGFRAAGRPVTRVVYTLLLTWVADVARDHGIPVALYWIQPAAVLAAYFHYFRGTGGAIMSALPMMCWPLAAVSEVDGVLEAGELRRCIDAATSEAVRASAAAWREKARAAVADGGSSEKNLQAYVGKIRAN